VVRPDLFLALGVGEYEHRFFVEVDRGTEHLPALIKKCRLYESYYASGREQAAHGVSPRTCWVVPDEPRARRLRRAIDGERHLTGELFVVTTTDQALAMLAGGSSLPRLSYRATPSWSATPASYWRSCRTGRSTPSSPVRRTCSCGTTR
jgi:hypothetical protein